MCGVEAKPSLFILKIEVNKLNMIAMIILHVFNIVSILYIKNITSH